MGKADVAVIKEIGRNLDRLAGEAVTKKVMEGSEEITEKTSKRKMAEWVKDAMERLDTLVDEKTGIQVMENCGYNCALVHKRLIERAKTRRKRYQSIDKFLEAEQRNPGLGSRLVREGDVLYQFYTPQSSTRPMRCYCSLLRGLPADEGVSLTYCHCGKGFVKRFWEEVLERPVKVELMQSVVSGAQEFKFEIYL